MPSMQQRRKQQRHTPNTGILANQQPPESEQDTDSPPPNTEPHKTDDGPPAEVAVHAPSYQPGTPGFVERRRDTSKTRRASDVVVPDLDVVTARVEVLLKQAMTTAIHRALPKAIKAAAAPEDSALKTAAEAALAANPQAPGQPAAEVRHGVRCPDYGTVTGRLWLLFAKAGAGCTLTQAKALARDNGMSETSAAIALYSWRKFHGVPSPRQSH